MIRTKKDQDQENNADQVQNHYRHYTDRNVYDIGLSDVWRSAKLHNWCLFLAHVRSDDRHPNVGM